MRRTTLVPILATLALSTACVSGSGSSGGSPSTGGAVASVSGAENRHAISPVGSSTVSGTVAVERTSSSSMRVTITLAGAMGGMVHPWHFHVGQCGGVGSGAIIGPPGSYTAIGTRGDGTSLLVQTLPFDLPPGPVYVNVHRSPSDLSVIACGNIKS